MLLILLMCLAFFICGAVLQRWWVAGLPILTYGLLLAAIPGYTSLGSFLLAVGSGTAAALVGIAARAAWRPGDRESSPSA
jgi:hypothetical protein